jgi:predicted O-methyltransferase YrrM
MTITKESMQEMLDNIVAREFTENPPTAELPTPFDILSNAPQIVRDTPDTDLENPKTWSWAVPPEIAIVEQSNSLMPLAQRYFLWSLIYGIAPRRYLEIGTDAGGSAMIVAGAIRALGVKDFRGVCIDPCFQLSATTRDYLGEGFSFIQSKNSPETVVEAGRRAGGLFDVVLVDGDHTYDYALADILLVTPYVALGGYILIDDAAHPQVRDAIAYALESHTLIDCGFMCRHTFSYDAYLPPIATGSWQGEKLGASGLYVLRKPLQTGRRAR